MHPPLSFCNNLPVSLFALSIAGVPPSFLCADIEHGIHLLTAIKVFLVGNIFFSKDQ